MAIPRLDPNAPKPRVHPGWIAAVLAIIGIIGAFTVYRLGDRGLERDRAAIVSFLDQIDAQVQMMMGTIERLEHLDPDDVAAFDEVFAVSTWTEFGGVTSPSVADPLFLRYIEVFRHLGAFAAGNDRMHARERIAATATARRLLDAADAERAELRCLARIECG